MDSWNNQENLSTDWMFGDVKKLLNFFWFDNGIAVFFKRITF